MIIGVSGVAGAGKDTVAEFLRPHEFVRVALADPIKRIAVEVYALTIEQCWGDQKEVLDTRYNRTPRHIMQWIGTQMGREIYSNTWVEYLLRVVNRLLNDEHYTYLYTGPEGLHDRQPKEYRGGKCTLPAMWAGVVVSDVRFQNEIDGLRAAGAKLIRVKRPGAGLKGGAAQHVSETEQDGIPDSAFDVVINNEGTLEDLRLQAEFAFRQFLRELKDQDDADFLEKVLRDAPVTYQSVKGFELVRPGAPVEIDLTKYPGVPFPLGTGKLATLEDGTEVLAPFAPGGTTEAALHMQTLLDQRAADVKAGRILEYDEVQKDVPPLLRKKKP